MPDSGAIPDVREARFFRVPSTCNDEPLKLFTRGRTRPHKRTALRRLCRHHAQCDPRNLAACNYKLVVL